MDATLNSSHGDIWHEHESLPLVPGRRELAFIIAFWASWALLSVGNRVFDPGGGPPGSTSAIALIAGTESLCWAIITPFFFWFVARIDLEGGPSSRRRAGGFLSLVIAAMAVALIVGFIGTELRTHLTPFNAAGARPGQRGGAGAFGRPRIWFGFINALLFAFAILATGAARAYSLRLRARREQAIQLTGQLAEARLDALRRQLDPHFLFNTLNAISSLVERDPRGVRRMIARLGDLLRHSFEGGRDPEVPLRRELSLLGLYVDIMKVRFQDRLTVDVQVDDSVLAALVPTFILQPLVENAIKHGIERQTEGGRIVVEGSRVADMVVLRVIDDGSDRDTSVATSYGSGVGLRNTRERLEHLYGSAQSFSLGAVAGVGTVAEVRLPFHQKSGNQGS
jgi:two-component system, LytTR family, sensor kinase